MRTPQVLREARWFFQRGRRGWAECDAWWMSSHLARVIADLARELREQGIGWSCAHDTDQPYEHEGCTPEAWAQYLQRIEFGFRFWLFIDEKGWTLTDDFEEQMRLEERAQEIVKLACELLGQHFGTLWD